MKEIIEKIDKYVDLQCAVDLINVEKNKLQQTVEDERQKQIDAVFPKELREMLAKIEADAKGKLNDIDVEFSDKTAALDENIAELKEEIKTDVINFGQSVKGEFAQAVYSKGRVSWDTKALDGFCKAHPILNDFRKVGEPSVSIRFSGGK